MPPLLYMLPASPAVRAVLLTAKAINLELEEELIDVFKKEHMRPEYLKINPQHTIPTLKDDDFIIWDSHAIMGYLIQKYAEDDTLYPTDPRKRAVVDQRLHFDSGVLMKHFNDLVIPILHKDHRYSIKNIRQETIDAVNEAYHFLEKFLEGNEWMAGDFLSIADFSIISTSTSLNLLIPINHTVYPKLVAWIHKCETWPFYEANSTGLDQLGDLFDSKLAF